MTPIRFLAVLCVLLPQCLPAQENIELPDFGDSAGTFISPAQERRLGSETMRDLRRDAPLIDDPEIEDYIRRLGGRIVKHADYYSDVNFFMIDDPQIQAFAIPGGYIGVHAGLILNSQSESEVASVLAHEVAHLTQRHTVRAIEAQGRAAIPALIGMLAAIALAATNPEAGQAAMAGVTALQQQYAINFSRANEQEADRLGIQLLYQSGFNPQAMPAFLQRLQLVNRYNDPAEIPEYLRTHPITINRVSEARERADRLPVVADESSIEYHLIWAKLKVLTADNPLQGRQYYEALLRTGEYQDEDVTLYGQALALTAAGSYAEARTVLDELLARDPDRIAYHIAAADLEQRAGEIPRAAEIYLRAYTLDPESRAALYGYANALTLTGRADEANRMLRDRGFRDDDDPRYFKLLAETAGRGGNPGDSRIAMAEYYFRIGEYPLAMAELEFAKDIPGLTNYQSQRIRARLVEIHDVFAMYREERSRRR